MSTLYDLDGLRLAIRERIGYDGTSVIGDTELTKMINDVLHDAWDILTQSDAVATEGPLTITTTANTPLYSVEDGSARSVYRVKRMALRIDQYSYPLETFEFGDEIMSPNIGSAWGSGGSLPKYRVKYSQFTTLGVNNAITQVYFSPPPSTAGQTIDYWFLPLPPTVSGGTDQPFAIRFPVGEYIILECAIRCMRRLRRDAGELMADRDRYLARIEQYYQPEQRERAPRALRTKSIRGLRGWPWR